MIKISGKKGKCVCDNCNKTKNGYRNIHSFAVADKHFSLCTECMGVLAQLIGTEFRKEFHDREETEGDVRLNEKLRVLLNRKVNNDWNEDCEMELQSLDVDGMRASDRVLHRQILEW